MWKKFIPPAIIIIIAILSVILNIDKLASIMYCIVGIILISMIIIPDKEHLAGKRIVSLGFFIIFLGLAIRFYSEPISQFKNGRIYISALFSAIGLIFYLSYTLKK